MQASSNDHYARIEIMKSARMRADPTNTLPITYFGDAEWDVRACQQLGVIWSWSEKEGTTTSASKTSRRWMMPYATSNS
ncbi:hypothetical protein [Enterovibrio norvegicus]|uniref:hypothetical protein n=1 Tax=Enterovibrio norvegicus TaxID=188144 RepID=UPI0024B22DDC|nr:hypothetical protein [Enterovibrio norvegicus]